MTEALTKVSLNDFPKVSAGKVRDIYDVNGDLLLVTSDRISAFDVVLPQGVPDKGRVLNLLSKFWFDHFKDTVGNHLLEMDIEKMPAPLGELSELKDRSMLVKKADMFPVECVARGYLVGSGYKDYKATGKVCGLDLPEGLQLADELVEPLFTPAAKNTEGHDENISFETMVDMIGKEHADKLKELTLDLYTRARAFAREKGIIIADTKFEFGLYEGEIILCDEVLTPDSSRFWDASTYQPGVSPPSFDKQYVRDYLETVTWDKTPPGPDLPQEVIDNTRAKYVEAFTRVSGQEFPY